MIFQFMQARDHHSDKVGRSNSELFPNSLTRSDSRFTNRFQIDAIVNNFDTRCRQAFVVDQCLSNSRTASDQSIAAAQKQSINDGPFATRRIRKMATVFCKYDRTSPRNAATQHGLKEGSALMSMQNLNFFTISKLL